MNKPMNMEKRLEELERTVQRMSQDQEQYSSLRSLADKAPHLVNVSGVLQSYEKRLKSIASSLQSAKSYVREVSNALPAYEAKYKNAIEVAVQRRDRNIKNLEGKLNNIEGAFSSLVVESQSTSENIENRVKEELMAGVKNLENQLEVKKKQFVTKLKNSQQKCKAKTSEYSKQLEENKNNFKKFQTANAAKLEQLAPVDPNSEAGRESLSNWLIEECSKEIFANIANRKDQSVFKFRTLSLHYNQEMLAFRTQLQDTRNEIINPPIKTSSKPEVQLSSVLAIMKNKLAATNFYSNATLEHLLEIISTFNEIVDELIPKAKRAEDVLMYKKSSDDTRERVSMIERNCEEQMLALEELLKKGDGFAKGCKDKKLPPRLKNMEKEFVGMRKSVKDKLNGLRAMVDSFQTKVVSVARQINEQEARQAAQEEEAKS